MQMTSVSDSVLWHCQDLSVGERSRDAACEDLGTLECLETVILSFGGCRTDMGVHLYSNSLWCPWSMPQEDMKMVHTADSIPLQGGSNVRTEA